MSSNKRKGGLNDLKAANLPRPAGPVVGPPRQHARKKDDPFGTTSTRGQMLKGLDKLRVK